MARNFATAIKEVDNAKLVAISSSHNKNLESFSNEFKIDSKFRYNDYESMAKSSELDAIYISTLNNTHFDLIKLCAIKNKNDNNAVALNINSSEYSVKNPSISTDGKTLYFSSDMPGGLGGEDIWKVSISQNSYGEPENLGAIINSSNNESFPFITSKNVLYFSSDKDAGFGGLDVYKIDFKKTHKVINVGAPINSEKDDFSFTLNDTKKTGFLSSNREDSDDIYLINPICRLYANIIVSDKETSVLINDAQLVLLENTSTPKDISSLQEVAHINL